IEGTRVGGMILRGKSDSLAGVYQAVPLHLIAAGAGRQNQAKAFFRCQLHVVPDQSFRLHRLLSFLASSTASNSSSRCSSSSTPMACSRALANVAVRRDFSPVGSSAASI